MNVGDLEKLVVESAVVLNGRIDDLGRYLDDLKDQLRLVSKRLNLSIAALQDHEAVVNRLSALEEEMADLKSQAHFMRSP